MEGLARARRLPSMYYTMLVGCGTGSDRGVSSSDRGVSSSLLVAFRPGPPGCPSVLVAVAAVTRASLVVSVSCLGPHVRSRRINHNVTQQSLSYKGCGHGRAYTERRRGMHAHLCVRARVHAHLLGDQHQPVI